MGEILVYAHGFGDGIEFDSSQNQDSVNKLQLTGEELEAIYHNKLSSKTKRDLSKKIDKKSKINVHSCETGKITEGKFLYAIGKFFGANGVEVEGYKVNVKLTIEDDGGIKQILTIDKKAVNKNDERAKNKITTVRVKDKFKTPITTEDLKSDAENKTMMLPPMPAP